MTPDTPGCGWAALPKSRFDDQEPEGERRAAGLSSAQIGSTVFVWGPPSLDATLRPLGVVTQPLVRPWQVTQVGAAFLAERPPGVRVLLDRGRHLVVDGLTADVAVTDSTCWRAEPLEHGMVIVEPVAVPAGLVAPEVNQLLDQVDAGRFVADIEALAGFGTRHSLTSGFARAATWAADRLTALGYAVTRVPISVGAGRSENVIADLPGTGPARGLVVVAAHLDSINLAGGPAGVAPGADDNASGSAGLLELARLLASVPCEHDLRMILFGGEEEGLHGSTQYVASLPSAERARCRAVLNLDMVATRNTVEPGVLLEGAPVSGTQIADLATAAATYTNLTVSRSLSPFASDHVPFIEAGMPAVLTIEGSDSVNTNIHSDRDTTDHIDTDLMAQILRMNLAALTGWLGSHQHRPTPAGPVVSRRPGAIDVFVIGTDHALHHGTVSVPHPATAPPPAVT